MKILPKVVYIGVVAIAITIGIRLLIERQNTIDFIALIKGNPERLFPAGFNATYDIQGLYEGASSVTLRASEDRFILPEPSGESPRILFLGGSTTEAIYVPESMRWVGLLNGYNGGLSASSIIDKINTLDYLTKRGDRFDLIVVMTAFNDSTWSIRLGDKFNVTDFPDAAFEFNLTLGQTPPPLTVLDGYLSQVAIGTQTLANCVEDDTWMERYSQLSRANFRALREAADTTNTPLLILSEPTSFGAPSSSFLHDLRATHICDGERLTLNDSALLVNDFNSRYLQAASDEGLDTFDLAGSVSAFTNGENGGRYLYDTMHYTADGSVLIADTLREMFRERYGYYAET